MIGIICAMQLEADGIVALSENVKEEIIGGMKFYLKQCEKVGNMKKHTGWLGIPSGGCVVENFPEKMYHELTTAEFCGKQFPIPKDYDENLRVVFGDYMQRPPVDKQKPHHDIAYLDLNTPCEVYDNAHRKADKG